MFATARGWPPARLANVDGYGLMRLRSLDNHCNEACYSSIRVAETSARRKTRDLVSEMLGWLGSGSREFSSTVEVKVARRSNAGRGSVARMRHRWLTGSFRL
ncbi:DNAJ heat shock N-terminal domain-containing protein [Striga asiatica]|uniref:DNAJ heat shock N-terminal domain-containing protein n=1 Tax=Striga asiatica TaxID=4170 RepID=A0A5A7PBG4_STRAF|nr:DNAJ heat shock N-terminal domain-containing protein [Striga asiatica]